MKKIISLIMAILMIATIAIASASCAKTLPNVIGVQTGTTGQYYVDGDADWGFDGINGFTSKGYNNGGLAVQDMKNGNVKYVIIDEQPAKQLAKKMDVKVIDVALTEEEYAFGVDKNQPELLASINSILAEMKTNGKLDEIVTAYATGEGIKPFENGTFDAAKADQQLVVATNAAFAPFEYKDGNKFAGIDMEIAAYIASELELELVIVDMDFDSVVTSVGKNAVDVAMAGLTVNEKRKEYVTFTDSYYNAAQMLIVPKNVTAFDNCKTADDVLAVLAKDVEAAK